MYKTVVENRIENLILLAKFVENIKKDYNLSSKIAFEINLVLDELITNTIQYGYNDDYTHLIEVMAEIKSDKIFIQIIDDAKKFNPLEKKEIDTSTSLKEREIGGLGIFFVQQKVDEFHYEYSNGQNHIYIKKKII